MPQFVKLTHARSKNKVLVNLSHVVSIDYRAPDGALLRLIHGGVLEVAEGTDAIFDMIVARALA